MIERILERCSRRVYMNVTTQLSISLFLYRGIIRASQVGARCEVDERGRPPLGGISLKVGKTGGPPR
jgi:hypothetical protein